MQLKVIIGTIAFMLSMMIMGYAVLREPARLEHFTHAQVGRSVETGAKLFNDNCSTCHGKEGKAEDCGPDGCQGLPLNYNALLCGDKSARMETMGWEGTKDAFIETTIAAGRMGSVMPTWSADFGGPLRGDQIRNITDFVLNWENEELCAVPIYQYEWPEAVTDFLTEFPEGDVARGAEVFLTYGCNACHGIPDGSAAASVGPDLGNLAADAATRIDGVSAQQYVYESILYPNDFIAPDCPSGPCVSPTQMLQTFYNRMGDSETKPQDMTDILSYLVGLDN